MESNHEFLWFSLIAFLAGVVAYVALKFVIRFAKKKQIVEVAGGRKRHEGTIPSLGGVGIYVPLVLILVVLCFLSPEPVFKVLAVAISFIVALGVYDDVVPLNASRKFLGQILIASLVMIFLHKSFGNMFSIVFLEYSWVTLSLLAFYLVFLMNAFNLIDGIDGLAGSLAVVSSLFFTTWFFQSGNYYHAFFSVSLSASLMVFLKLNVIDRKIFLGDNGSMLLGLVLGVLACEFLRLQGSTISYLRFSASISFVLALTFVPIFDVIRLFMIRYIYLEKSPFKPDRNHIHHLLLRLGFSQNHATLILVFIAIVLIGISLLLDDMGNLYVLVVLTLIMSAFVLFADVLLHYKFRGRIEKKTVFQELSKFRMNIRKPEITDFIFGFTIYLLFVAIPFFRVSTTIPTLMLLLLMMVIVVKAIYDRGGIPIKLKIGWTAFYKHAYSLMLGAFLLIHVLWTFWFKDATLTYQAVSLIILMILFWGIMFFQFYALRIELSDVFSAYVLGCLAFGVYIIMAAIQDMPKEGLNALYYTNLLDNVKGNPIIHSLYFNLAIVFLLHSGLHSTTKYRNSFVVIIILFFAALVLLFGSKIGYFILLVSLSYVFFKEFKKPKYRIAAFAVSLTAIVVIYLTVPFVNLRINDFADRFVSHENTHIDQQLPRTIVWQNSWELIKEAPIIGYGTGMSRPKLYEKYVDIGWHRGKLFHFNAHNQYFETWLQTGILGLIVLLLIIAYSAYMAVKKKNLLHLFFLAVVSFYMLFESLLETQMGVVGFALFNALFIAQYYLNDEEKKQQALATDELEHTVG